MLEWSEAHKIIITKDFFENFIPKYILHIWKLYFINFILKVLFRKFCFINTISKHFRKYFVENFRNIKSENHFRNTYFENLRVSRNKLLGTGNKNLTFMANLLGLCKVGRVTIQNPAV